MWDDFVLVKYQHLLGKLAVVDVVLQVRADLLRQPIELPREIVVSSPPPLLQLGCLGSSTGVDSDEAVAVVGVVVVGGSLDVIVAGLGEWVLVTAAVMLAVAPVVDVAVAVVVDGGDDDLVGASWLVGDDWSSALQRRLPDGSVAAGAD